MANANEEYVVASSFKVTIEGMTSSNFDLVSGMGLTFEDVKQQAEKGISMVNRPGRYHARDITLRRRLKKDKEMANWVKILKGGKQDRRAGSIIILDDEDKEVARYNFTGAWPKDWFNSDLTKDGKGNSILSETIVLSVQDLEMV